MTEQPPAVKQEPAGNTAANTPANTPASTPGEPEFAPQRGGWWVDVLIVVVIVAILLGGVGMAINDSELLKDTPATATDVCPPGGCTKPPGEGCIERPIKGVVLATGEHLYYVGTHPGYTGVIAMHTERGDRWFCSEETAAAAGFSPAP